MMRKKKKPDLGAPCRISVTYPFGLCSLKNSDYSRILLLQQKLTQAYILRVLFQTFFFMKKFSLQILGKSHYWLHYSFTVCFSNVDLGTVHSSDLWLHFVMSRAADFICYFVACFYCLIFYILSHTKSNMEDCAIQERRICVVERNVGYTEYLVFDLLK